MKCASSCRSLNVHWSGLLHWNRKNLGHIAEKPVYLLNCHRTLTTNSPVDKEQPPPREFYGCMRSIKSSPMKLNLVAKLIRRMPVAQALAQVEFCEKKVAEHVKMVITDIQRKAVKHHKVHPLNLWVGKGQYLRHIRYHGKGMHSRSHKMYAHYFLILREGKPPKKKRSIEDHKSRLTKKLINAGPRSIPNSL